MSETEQEHNKLAIAVAAATAAAADATVAAAQAAVAVVQSMDVGGGPVDWVVVGESKSGGGGGGSCESCSSSDVVVVVVVEDGGGRENEKVSAGKTVAQLLDSGNFVLRRENDENPANYIWESFKNPTDTLLPGMKLGWDRKTGANRFLQSWKTSSDPGSGDYVYKMNIDGLPEVILLEKKRTEMITEYRSEPWNGRMFSSVSSTSWEDLIKSHDLETRITDEDDDAGKV
ncbi:hypothetical protein QVD17_27567 [Tagetes erecta]|uniref:Bulb-type lectin domain-containing protein n=1 Tax=Tagetes erecta TaxID=13708 RepID=A0AAD8K9A6_TARER|nr:hypothetical protein QVD17_27567 [Tagetes erecta]